MARRAARRLWILGGLVLVFLTVKFFLADVYRIESDSMRPALFGGDEGEALSEWVLVRYDRGFDPERAQLVVARPPGGGRPIVKRVAAVRGETVGIEGGDLLVNGKRLAPDAPRPAPTPIFDDELFGVAEHFRFDAAPEGPWSEETGEWVLDGHAVAPGSNQGMMFYRPPLTDDHLMPSGLRVKGKRQVNDAVLEVRFRLDEALVDRLRFQLTEEGDVFEARLGSHPHDAGWYVVRLHREPGVDDGSLPQGNVELETGRWYTLRFANVDNHLSVELPGLGFALSHTYTSNRPHPTAHALGDPRHGEKSFGERVALGGEGCRARFRDLRILRDVFYTDVDEHGTRQNVVLGLDEYFLLGDNSAHSRDSRALGPFKQNQLLGRPVAVVWPPARVRLLGRPLGRSGQR